MNSQVFPDKLITVIVVLMIGGLLFFFVPTVGLAAMFDFPFELPAVDFVLPPIEIFKELTPIAEDELITPPKQTEVPTFEEIKVEAKEELDIILDEILEKKIEEIEMDPPKTINLNELTETIELFDLNKTTVPDLNESIAPPFKTFKEEVTWYSQFANAHTLEEIPLGCDAVVVLYKETPELDNKSYLAKIILGICDLG